METWDTVVVGGGAAGLAAALTLSRALRATLLIDAGSQRNRAAEHSHGVLGLDGMAPARFADMGRAEVASFGGVICDARIDGARVFDGGFELETSGGDLIRCRHLIVTTGVTDLLPNVPGVVENWGRQVVICPYCDGWEVQGRRIGVLATGQKSVAQAHLLRQWSQQIVFLVNDAVVLDEAQRTGFAARGIRLEDGAVTDLDRSADGSMIARLSGGRTVEVDVVFTAPRAVPNDALMRQLGARTVETTAGPLIAVDPRGATSVPGLWAAGNVVDPTLKIPTALGDGMAIGTHVNEALVAADLVMAVAAFSADDQP
jgi:thioredoxin reductase